MTQMLRLVASVKAVPQKPSTSKVAPEALSTAIVVVAWVTTMPTLSLLFPRPAQRASRASLSSRPTTKRSKASWQGAVRPSRKSVSYLDSKWQRWSSSCMMCMLSSLATGAAPCQQARRC